MAGIPEKLDGNTLAEYVCAQEGGAKELDIAQVKEVIGIISDVAAKRPVELISLLERLGKN